MMCAIDDGEPYKVYHSVMRKARKVHKCLECGRTISPGETYKYGTGLFDGEWNVNKHCSHCLSAGDWLVLQCGGWPNGELGSELRDHAEEYRSVRFGLLRSYVGVRRGWKRFDGLGLMPLPLPVPQPEYT